MVFALEETENQQAFNLAKKATAKDLPVGFTESFSNVYNANAKYRQSNSLFKNEFEAWQDYIDHFYKETGERLEHPYALWQGQENGDFDLVEGDREGQFVFAIEQMRQRYESHVEQNPNATVRRPPSPDEVSELALGTAKRAFQKQVKQQQTTLSDFSSATGEFVGDMASAVTDPVNVLAMGFGAARGLSVFRTAGQEALIAGMSEAYIQKITDDFRRQVDPDRDINQALSEIGMAAFGAGAFSAATQTIGRGIGNAVQRWKGHKFEKAVTEFSKRIESGEITPAEANKIINDVKSGEVDIVELMGQTSRRDKDAENVVMKKAATETPPFKKTIEEEAAHSAAVNKVIDDIVTEKPVELPVEAQVSAKARPGDVFASDGSSVNVRYEVAEMFDLITSHNSDMTVNPSFPAELQPRDRSRNISHDQITNIAANLQPHRLGPNSSAETGAPIIGNDDVVESGNGRVLAIKRAYDNDTPKAAEYRAFLKDQGYDVDGMDAPVLIARRTSPLTPEQREKFTAAANASIAMRMSDTEQAMADARHLDESVLSLYQKGDVGSVENRKFASALISKFGKSEQGNLIDARGNLSVTGLRRLESALLARSFNEPALLTRLLEDTDNNIKTIGNALVDVSPQWARMRDDVKTGAIPRGMDITDDVLDAVKALMRARDEKRPFAEIINQAEMFGGPSDISKKIAGFFFRNGKLKQQASRRAIADMLEDYAVEARKNLDGDRLFGDALGEGDILETALRKAGRDDLINEAKQELSPEKIDKLEADPKVDDQVIQEAKRMLGNRATGDDGAQAKGEDLQIPVSTDDAGNITYRSMSEVMDEIDDELDAAKEIEACAVGKADTE